MSLHDTSTWSEQEHPGGARASRRSTYDAAVPAPRTKRIYDEAEPDDGYRVLVDRVWPRGVSRERARLDEWARDLAPSNELRKWFAHRAARFEQFRLRYREELTAQAEKLSELSARARRGPVTILYAARDREHSNAVVLAELLSETDERETAARG